MESADAEATEPTETTEPAESSPEPGSAEDALPYLEALGRSSDPAPMEAGLEYAHPDWPAHGYLQHQANGARANLITGNRPPDDLIELREDNIQLCRDSGCTTFGDFVFADVETESVGVSTIDATHESADGGLGFLNPFYGISGQDYFTPGSPGQIMLQFDSVGTGGTAALVLQCVEGCNGEVILSLPLE